MRGVRVRQCVRALVCAVVMMMGVPCAMGALEWRTVPKGMWARDVQYAIVLPDGFDAAREYPVVVAFAPGKGEREMVEKSVEGMWEAEARKRGWVVVALVGDADSQQVGRVLGDVALRVRVESGVVHCAGVSRGGCAAFAVAAAMPERVASVLAMPGYAERDEDAKAIGKRHGVRATVFVGEKDEEWRAKAERTRQLMNEEGTVCEVKVVQGERHQVNVALAAMFGELEKSRVEAKKRTGAQGGAAESRACAEVSAVLDHLHEYASKGEGEAYFALYTPDAVFMGTDPTERWSVEQFRAYAKPAFEKGKGWTYHPSERAVRVADGERVAWFDEMLDHAKYGRCRGSGVLVKGEDGAWRITQYNLSVPIPNDLLEGVVGMWKKK